MINIKTRQSFIWNGNRFVYGLIMMLIGCIVGYESTKQVSISMPIMVLTIVTIPAYVLATRNSRILVPYIVAVWGINPEIRRYIDWILGSYHQVTVISLAPLLCTFSVVIPIFTNRKKSNLPKRMIKVIKIIGVVFIYGLILGIVRNKTAGIYSGANYIIPFFLLIYLMHIDFSSEVFDGWLKWISFLAVFISLYGWIQFIVAPPWDTMWMVGSGMQSIGLPEPYKIRIFSTLNSPGPLGIFLTTALIPMIVRRKWRVFGLFGILTVASCLALTLVRSSWGEVLVGLIVYLASTSGKSRAYSLMIISFTIVLGFAIFPHLPGSHSIIARGNSVTNLSQDNSFQVRLQLIRTATPTIIHNPFGVGMGGIGISSYLNGGNAFANLGSIDNGYLGIFATFGIFIGFLLLYAIFLFLRETWELTNSGYREYHALSRAIIVMFLATLVFGGALQSLQAILLWIFAIPIIINNSDGGLINY